MKKALLVLSLLALLCCSACSSGKDNSDATASTSDASTSTENSEATAAPTSTPQPSYTSGKYKYIVKEDGTAEIIDYFDYTEKNISIPRQLDGYTVSSIGHSAFYDMDTMRVVSIPSTIKQIGDRAFDSCDSLQEIDGMYDVEVIGAYAFTNCKSLCSVYLPSDLKELGAYAFYNCDGFTSMSLPRSLTTISEGMFSCCDQLFEFTVPQNVTRIEESAFSYSYLHSITLNSKVSEIVGNPFVSCLQLRNIKVPGDNRSFMSDNGVLYERATNKLIACPISIITDSYTILDGTKIIGSHAFMGNTNYSHNNVKLKSVVIPASVTSIEENAFLNHGDLNLIVEAGSYAESYAKENGMTYSYSK